MMLTQKVLFILLVKTAVKQAWVKFGRMLQVNLKSHYFMNQLIQKTYGKEIILMSHRGVISLSVRIMIAMHAD